MSRKRYSSVVRRGLPILVVALALAAILPNSVPGETIRLKDGSTLKGRLVRVDGDTLTIRLSIGSGVKVHRAQIESIGFLDSAIVQAPAIPTTQPATGVALPVSGTGTLSVKFEDRRVTSKITINKKKNWDEKIRSNHILVELVVDGVVAYTAADTTMDKTIYQGEEKQIKNDAELDDFTLKVSAGKHVCTLVVRNRDGDTFRDSFDPAPLSTVLEFGELTVSPGGVVRLDIKMDKGFLKMSSPRLYRANTGEE